MNTIENLQNVIRERNKRIAASKRRIQWLTLYVRELEKRLGIEHGPLSPKGDHAKRGTK